MGHAIQIQGNFYTAEGKQAAARELARRLTQNGVNEPGACVRPAPRGKRRGGSAFHDLHAGDAGSRPHREVVACLARLNRAQAAPGISCSCRGRCRRSTAGSAQDWPRPATG